MNGKHKWLIVMAMGVLAWTVTAGQAEVDYPHGEYEGKCSLCHGNEGWRPAQVSPDFVHTSRFLLKDAHSQAECVACHESLLFAETGSQCIDCHGDVHRGEFGQDCGRCHTARNFIDRGFMVSAHQSTRFPLRGSHRSLDCEDCHSLVPEGQLQYVNRSTDCEGCHFDDYQATVSPDHNALSFPTDCENCHAPILWDLTPGSFDHTSVTGTPCETCHLSDYNGAVDPDHARIGLPTDCMLCHTSTVAWDLPGGFNHDLVPGIDCVECHQDDFNATVDPSHIELTLPTDCVLCHTGTTSWVIAGGFDHAVVAGRPCESCHLSDFQATTNPDHESAMFPLDCTECHNSTTTWLGAEFDHDGLFFPIYSGKHNGKWDDCSDCHTNPSNFATFSCIDCHKHNDRNKVDNDHSDVSEYNSSSYNSNECFRCHPQGRKD